MKNHTASAFAWRQRPWFRNLDLLIAITALSLISFSLPGRDLSESGGIDIIALLKAFARIGAVVWFGTLCLFALSEKLTSRDQGANHSSSRRRTLFPVLIPFWGFALWAMVTVGWSNLRGVSFGQWLGLLALMLIAQTIAMRTNFTSSSNPTDSPAPTKTLHWLSVVKWLNATLTIYCLVVAIVHIAAPDLSGLNRELLKDGHGGLVHPTAAGASSGLAVLISAFLLRRANKTGRWPYVFSLAIALLTLLFSESRSSLSMTLLVVATFTFALSTMRTRATAMIGIGCICFGVLVLDPGFNLVRQSAGHAADYVQRGQSVQQLKDVSGRTEMWTAVWEQYQKAKLLGHGYFLSSETGKLYVWRRYDNHEAHNLVLQLLVSTGLIGACLFAWGVLGIVWSWVRGVPSAIQSMDEHGQFSFLFLAVAMWFTGWCQGCTSLIGPIRPESVLFFVVLGLFAALAAERQTLPFGNRIGEAG